MSRVARRKAVDARRRHKTGKPGVYWRGTDKNRRYEIVWECYGTCEKHESRGQHRQRSPGDFGDAVDLLHKRKREVADLRARRARGEDIKCPSSRTFHEVAREYLESRAFKRLAEGTQKKYRETLDLRVLPRFEDVPIADVTTDDIADLLDSLRTAPRRRRRGEQVEGLSESTINATLTAVRVVFKFAASRSRRYITTDPVKALEGSELPTPDDDKREVQVLDEAELARLLVGAPEAYRLMLELKAGTGLRSAELRALVWEDLDLDDRKRIKVSRQIDTYDRGDRVAIKDRSLTDWRYVPLTDRLVSALTAHRDRMASRGLARPGHFVFGGLDHVKHGALDDAFRVGVEAARIKREPDKRLSLHSLRHGYGSLLLAHGNPLSAVSAWLGHRRLSTTERWYTHRIHTLLDVAAEQMRERERARPTVAVAA
jgi:integrase